MIDGEFSERNWLAPEQLLHCRGNLATETRDPDPGVQLRQTCGKVRISTGIAQLGLQRGSGNEFVSNRSVYC
jgi:hypothetical protein